MTRSNPRRSAATQFLIGALAATVLLFAPSATFAQHGGGGGGHVGGGGGGGHFGGGGGISHASAPAASHSTARPPARSAPVTKSRPAIATSAHQKSTSTNAVTARQSLFGAPASSGSGGAFALHAETAAPRSTVIGFPPSESRAWQSAPVDSGPLSFSGQGHEIWQNSPSPTGDSAAVARPSSSNRSVLGERALATTARPAPPHRVFFPPRVAPIIFFPGFGFFGNGFGCDPFFGWGFDQSFGCNNFGYGFGYGGYYGAGYGYNLGSGYDSSYLMDSAGPSDSSNGAPNEYGPFSVASPSLQDSSAAANGDSSSTDAGAATAVTAATPAPSATTIFLKDGTSYEVMSYWLDAGKLHFITNYRGENSIDMSQLDLQRTVDENAQRGANFTLLPAPASPAPDAAPSSSTGPSPAPAPTATPAPQQ